MTVKIFSFGAKITGSKPPGLSQDEFYDCRNLVNPFRVMSLRDLTGEHWRIKMFVKNDEKYPALMNPIFDSLEDGKTFAFYCYGGTHRSVACAEDLAERCTMQGLPFELTHRVLGKHRKG